MNLENKKIVMFDFDGVLANTLELSFEIHKIKNPELTWKHFQDYSNGNFHDGYNKAVKDGKHIPADDFPGQYKNKLQLLTIHDILHDAILGLASDYILVIISSAGSSLINDFLIKENLDNCFTSILGTDIHKSKVVKIKMVLDKYNINSKNAVFITDTLGDIKEAKECEVESIAVTWGLHPKETLIKGHPFAIIDDPQDLFSIIKNVLK